MTSSTTTQTTTTSSTVSTTTPQKILQNDTLSKSISNYTQPILYARSRNIVFTATGLKPLTKHYAFFDGTSVDQYITTKYIEINMISGVFQVGELVESDPLFTSGRFSCRLCAPNHLEGPYNSPTEVFTNDIVAFPLAQTYGLTQSSYSASSKSLNIDILSLANPAEVAFSGYTRPKMRLIGRSSGAIAEVVQSILVSDDSGLLTGSFFIPDPTFQTNPKFINGTNTFTLSNISSPIDTNYLSFASAGYYSSGTTNVTDINNITTRNYTIIPARTINTTTITNTTQNIITQTVPTPEPKPSPPQPKSYYPFAAVYTYTTQVGNEEPQGGKVGYSEGDPIVTQYADGSYNVEFINVDMMYRTVSYEKVEVYAEFDGDSTRYTLYTKDLVDRDTLSSNDPEKGSAKFKLDKKYFGKNFMVYFKASGCSSWAAKDPNLICNSQTNPYIASTRLTKVRVRDESGTFIFV